MALSGYLRPRQAHNIMGYRSERDKPLGVIDMADKQPTIRPEIWLIAGGLVIGCAFLVLWLTTW